MGSSNEKPNKMTNTDSTTIKRGRGSLPKEITEHGISMYTRRGCRCDICRSARYEQQKSYRKRSDEVKLRLDPTPLLERLEATGNLAEVHRNKRQQWQKNGIDVYWADYYCIKFGYHPSEIFGAAFYQLTNEEEAA